VVEVDGNLEESAAGENCKNTLQTFVEAGRIEKWAIPDKFIVVDEIPKTSVGKIDKKLLRKMYGEGKL
jgi:fatty-acyl-CoA synthase